MKPSSTTTPIKSSRKKMKGWLPRKKIVWGIKNRGSRSQGFSLRECALNSVNGSSNPFVTNPFFKKTAFRRSLLKRQSRRLTVPFKNRKVGKIIITPMQSDNFGKKFGGSTNGALKSSVIHFNQTKTRSRPFNPFKVI